MPHLCPKGTDWAVKLSVPSCTLPLYGAPNWTGWGSGHPFRRGCLSWKKFKQYQLWSILSRGSKVYIEAFMGLTLLYDLTWKDVMFWDRHWFLTQKLEFWGKLLLLEMNGLKMRQGERGSMKSPSFLLWAKQFQQQCHFVRCILEGHKRILTKTLNYAKSADIERGEKETPGTFLDRLWEAVHECTDIDLESSEGGTILKNRFLTHLASDIFHKLLKQVFGPNQSLEKLLQLAQMVCYGRGYEEENRKKKRTRQRTEAPIMAVRSTLKQLEE